MERNAHELHSFRKHSNHGRAIWKMSGHNSLDKDFSEPAARVLIPWKIYFRGLCRGLNQRANVFDDVEINVANFPCPQPTKNRATLQSHRHFSQRGDGELRSRDGLRGD